MRGHGDKIREAVAALDARGMLPAYLRPTVRDSLVLLELTRLGYGRDLPSRWAIRRAMIRLGRAPAPDARDAHSG